MKGKEERPCRQFVERIKSSSYTIFPGLKATIFVFHREEQGITDSEPVAVVTLCHIYRTQLKICISCLGRPFFFGTLEDRSSNERSRLVWE